MDTTSEVKQQATYTGDADIKLGCVGYITINKHPRIYGRRLVRTTIVTSIAEDGTTFETLNTVYRKVN